VANMFLLPLGWLAGGEVPLAGAAGNLLWVSLGNVIGGAGGVALAYRFAFPAMAGK
jgi:formate/nitrite transporter FocA (FNT family)